MGLPWQLLETLLAQHRRAPLRGPLLSLAEPKLDIFRPGLARMVRSVGAPHDTAVAERLDAAHGQEAIFTDVCALLGLGEPEILDVGPFPGVTIVHDLNDPVPAALHGRFASIFDFGTLEHIFEVPTCLRSITRMLAIGGTVVHHTPANNYFNHGFYQVSATLFSDYYRANGFERCEGTLAFHRVNTPTTMPFNMTAYEERHLGNMNSVLCAEQTQMVVLFSATKAQDTDGGVRPIQSFYRHSMDGTYEQWSDAQTQITVRYDASGARVGQPVALHD
jgi:hypothetical protein